MTLDDDVAFMLADPTFTVPVTFGTRRARGHLDRRDVQSTDANGFQALERVTVLVVATGALPGVEVGSAVTADGRSYQVRDVRLEGDGRVTELLVAEA